MALSLFPYQDSKRLRLNQSPNDALHIGGPSPKKRKMDQKHCYLQAFQQLRQATLQIQEWCHTIEQLDHSLDELRQINQDDGLARGEQGEPRDQLRVVALQMERSELDIKMQRKRQFIQSLRLVPLELFEQILVIAIDGGAPKQTLQCVCKCWREALLSIPRIWSNISVTIPRHIVKSVPFLKRRIELAKGTPLNVTLSAQCGERKVGIIKSLHSLVFATGTHRWRSLTILDGNHHELKDWISSAFHGEFTSLEELDIRYTETPENDIYNPIYLSIERTANRLISLSLAESQVLPEFLEQRKDLYSSLVTFKAGIHLAWELPSNTLLNLELLGDTLTGDVSKLDFPPFLSLPSLSLDLFQNCKFDKVTHLTVHRLEAEASWAIWTVNLPVLLSLTCHIAKLSALPCIQAPHLRDLSMGIWTPTFGHWGGRLNNQDDRDITRVFQARTFSIHIRPTTLRLESSIPVRSLCIILERWPQIEHLSFQYGYDLNTLKKLEASLTARENVSDDDFSDARWSLCPVLVTLHIEIDEDDVSQDWRGFGKNLLYARRNASLRRFTWGSGLRISTLVSL